MHRVMVLVFDHPRPCTATRARTALRRVVGCHTGPREGARSHKRRAETVKRVELLWYVVLQPAAFICSPYMNETACLQELLLIQGITFGLAPPKTLLQLASLLNSTYKLWYKNEDFGVLHSAVVTISVSRASQVPRLLSLYQVLNPPVSNPYRGRSLYSKRH